METINFIHLLKLKTRIKSLALHRKMIKLEIKKLSPSNKNEIASAVRHDKKSEARHYHLAYGLLRGTPYPFMESKCQFRPSAERILKIIKEDIPVYNENYQWTIEQVKHWLDKPLAQEESKLSKWKHKIQEFLNGI